MVNAQLEPADSGDDDGGIETVDNPERGCGHLKEGKAYLRSELSAHGVLPPVVEFDDPVLWLEGHLRGYSRFPGVQFELESTPKLRDYMDGDLYDHASDGSTAAVVDDAMNDSAVRDSTDALGLLRGSDPDGEWITRADPPLEVHRHVRRLKDDSERDGPFPHSVGEMRSARAHDLLMWVGESYYDTPEDFLSECRQHGLSKAIPTSKNQEPPVINPGRTRVFLIHPRAVERGPDRETGDMMYEAGIIGYAYVTRVIYTGSSTGDGDVDFPEWAQEQAFAGRMDLVEIGEAIPEERAENGCSLTDFTGDADGDDDAAESDVRDVLDKVPHQKLRSVAANHDLDVSQNPKKSELIDAIVDAGVASAVDGGDGE